MSPTLAQDLAYALRNAPGAVVVTLGASSTYGLVDCAGEEDLEASGAAAMSEKSVLVTVATGALTGLAIGAALTANSVSYRVHRFYPFEDGTVTRIVCAPA